MKTITVNKNAVKKAIIKMREDKITVRSFLQGKISAETLSSKNIKFFKII